MKKFFIVFLLLILLSACTQESKLNDQTLTQAINMNDDKQQVLEDQGTLEEAKLKDETSLDPNAIAQKSVPSQPKTAQPPLAPGTQALPTVNELQIEDIQVGTGTEAQSGNNVTVHYTGTLTNGQKFDSSLDRGQPFSFNLGVGEVIRGWDQGVIGMKVGGKRKLIIPAHLAYGDQGAGQLIPPGATLVFEVELLGVK